MVTAGLPASERTQAADSGVGEMLPGHGGQEKSEVRLVVQEATLDHNNCGLVKQP